VARYVLPNIEGLKELVRRNKASADQIDRKMGGFKGVIGKLAQTTANSSIYRGLGLEGKAGPQTFARNFSASSSRPQFFDPHFHIFNINEGGPHKSDILTPPHGGKIYSINDYEKSMINEEVDVIGGMFVEVIPEDQLKEIHWVNEQLETSKRIYGIVAGIDLTKDKRTVLQLVRSMKHYPRFRGVRHLLNYNPAWCPRVKHDLLSDPNVLENFRALEEEEITFDLHCNPHQLLKAAEVFKTMPNLRVIIDHLGVPKVAEMKGEAYNKGMEALAACPNVFLKVGSMGFITPERDMLDYVYNKVVSLIKMFTP